MQHLYLQTQFKLRGSKKNEEKHNLIVANQTKLSTFQIELDPPSLRLKLQPSFFSL